MALPALLSGAECAASTSVLAQFIQHSQHDRSLQQERHGGPTDRLGRGAGLRCLPFRSSQRDRYAHAGPSAASPHAASSQAITLPRPGALGEFDLARVMGSVDLNAPWNGGAADPMRRPAAPSDFDTYFQARACYPSLRTATTTAAAPSLDFGLEAAAPKGLPTGWKDEFHQSRSQPAPSVTAGPPRAQARAVPMGISGMHGGMGMGTGMGIGGMPDTMSHSMLPPALSSGGMGSRPAQAQQSPLMLDPRLAELSDERWEAEFAKVDEQVGIVFSAPTRAEATAQARTEKKGKAREDPQTTDRLDTDAPVDETEKCMYSEVGRVALDPALEAKEGPGQGSSTAVSGPVDNNEAYPSLDSRSGTKPELEPGLARASTSWLGQDLAQEAFLSGMNSIHADGAPQSGEYKVEVSNPFLSHPDPLAEGVRLLADGGLLSDAILLFEAATQRSATPASTEAEEVRLRRYRSEAWRRLGEAHAMNEMEVSAIRALEKAIAIDESNRSALIPLAVSYTNEGYDVPAWNTLRRYITRAYPHLRVPDPDAEPDPDGGFKEVTDLFLRAAREGAAKGVVDADVQVGLGVLYFSSQSFLQARDCFQSALAVRPDDILLWNRLGAVLANSGKSEEAIEAYQRALELCPSFTRATYNLSVSCLNLGAHHEAAEHLLAAIALQRTAAAPQVPREEGKGDVSPVGTAESQTLWSTLRRIFVRMERVDLANKAYASTPLLSSSHLALISELGA